MKSTMKIPMKNPIQIPFSLWLRQPLTKPCPGRRSGVQRHRVLGRFCPARPRCASDCGVQLEGWKSIMKRTCHD